MKNKILYIIVFFGFIILDQSSATAAAGPSFDCDRATTLTEKAICADATLSELDLLIGDGYRVLRDKQKFSSAKKISKELFGMRESCNGERLCVMRVQVELLRRYNQFDARLLIPKSAISELSVAFPDEENGMPKTPGECVISKIVDIHGRLEGDQDFSSGTAVTYENGGLQIGHEREVDVIESKKGDQVEICLISLPDDCPPFDDRGYTFQTKNLRTKKTWIMDNSTRLCGVLAP